jgi:protein-disulfide isomerase
MSEDPQQPVPAPDPAPVVVVGYPEVVSAQPSEAAVAVSALRRQVRTLRYLLVACLGLLIVLMIGLGAAVSGSRSQLDALSTQVSGLADRAVAAPQPAPQPEPSPSAAAVEQLPPASELPGVAAVPAGADATGAILIGNPDATNVVEVYIDYQCPFCQKWESSIGTALVSRALQPGSDLLVKQYNLAFLGETSPDLTPAGASARAANAAACVVDNDGVDTFVTFSRTLFETADPSEPPGQFTADVLADLAKKAGASAASVDCITAEENVPFVSAVTKAGFGRGVGGTPTVVLNGETLGNSFTDERVIQLAAPTS